VGDTTISLPLRRFDKSPLTGKSLAGVNVSGCRARTLSQAGRGGSTEAYLLTLGWCSSADLGPEQLKLFGVIDPNGHTL